VVYSSLEICKNYFPEKNQIKAIIFDFDGTISTFRHGWELVMEPLMMEMIGGGTDSDELKQMIREYIDSSTGVQTIFQMQWLAEKVREYGLHPEPKDAWWYKDEYNRRLMEQISGRIQSVQDGEVSSENYIMTGAVAFIKELKKRGFKLYLASGTDHDDVCKEAKILGVFELFELVMGAPERKAACPKEAVIRKIMQDQHLKGSEMAVVGDGKVEIALAVEIGAYALGIASNEATRHGINAVKRQRLISAGAHGISGNFVNKDELIALFYNVSSNKIASSN